MKPNKRKPARFIFRDLARRINKLKKEKGAEWVKHLNEKDFNYLVALTDKEIPDGYVDVKFKDDEGHIKIFRVSKIDLKGRKTLEGYKGKKIDLRLTPQVVIKDITITDIKKPPGKLYSTKDKKQVTLFPNQFDNGQTFGISRGFSDKYKKLIEEITPETAEESYKRNKKVFRIKDSPLALRVIDEKNKIQTASQFYQALERIKSGKVLQTLLALWAYSNRQGNFFFRGIKLNKIMETVLKKPKSGYFGQRDRKEFSEAINHLRDFEIYLDQYITDTDDRGRKKTMIKRDFYKLIDLIGAVYAKRIKDVKDGQGNIIYKKGTADESVIVRIYGELLPRFNKGIMRGRLYSRGLLELDANKDETAILLGFKLLTRFDQIRQGKTGKDQVADNRLYIKVDRKTLIGWAGYTKSDATSKWIASQYLKKTLDKLVDVKCLRSYAPETITIDDALQITLYPHPIALKLPDRSGAYLPLYGKPSQSWDTLPLPQRKEAYIKWAIGIGKTPQQARSMWYYRLKKDQARQDRGDRTGQTGQ